MKNIIYCAIIALFAISCDTVEESWKTPTTNVPLVIPDAIYAQTPTPYSGSRALLECLPESWDSAEDSTRTYATPDNESEYSQFWSAGDAFSMFYTTSNLQYVLQSYGDGSEDVGIFSLVGEASAGTELTTGYYYGVYPYKSSTKISKRGVVTYQFPSTQHYNSERNGDSYSNGENGMIAIEPQDQADSVLYFQNFCCYLQLRLATNKGVHKTVTRITLMANDESDALSGEGTVEIASENSSPKVKMKRSASNSIMLDCGSGVELSQDFANPSKFWFVLPGDFTFTRGFNVSVMFDDNSYYKMNTSKSIAIARSHIKPMATLNPITIEAIGPIRYKYNDPSINEPFPLNNTFFDENGNVLDIVNQEYDEATGEWVVYLSGTIKTIGDNSFEGPGPDLEYIKVDTGDDGSILVRDFAFYNCTADNVIINNDVDSINQAAFKGSLVENVIINGHVGVIATGSFSGCATLQTVNIASADTIENNAFFACTALREVSIPGVKYVGNSAFEECDELQSIVLDSVVTIGDAAFWGCDKLETVVISENCEMICEGAFCNSFNLSTIYCYAVYPPFIRTDNSKSSYVFDNVDPDICIYIPAGSEDYYLDGYYFEDYPYDTSLPNWDVNWWYEEYDGILYEMD